MNKMTFVLPEKLEEDFRKVIFKKYGMKKGNISKAMNEAINLWLKPKKSKTKSKKK